MKFSLTLVLGLAASFGKYGVSKQELAEASYRRSEKYLKLSNLEHATEADLDNVSSLIEKKMENPKAIETSHPKTIF